MSQIFELFRPTIFIWAFIFKFWWVWLAPLSLLTFGVVFLYWRRELYKESIEWMLVEIKLPREVDKSPKAMEQFLAAIHGLRNSPGDFLDKYQGGEVTLWFSLEVASIEGDIHFYMRYPSKYHKIILANLYANYPMLEVEEVTDYMLRFPPTLEGLYNENWDFWGAEVIQGEKEAFPIRTYLQFEHIEESMALDPIAAFLEIFQKCSNRENLFFQILIRPASSDWKKEGEKVIKTLKAEGLKKLVGPLGEYEDKPIRTPGETDRMKLIEQKLTKSGFETCIRYIYITRPDLMNKEFARRGIATVLNQYSAQNMNFFLRNGKTTTDTKWTYSPWIFPAWRNEIRKRKMYRNYRKRVMPEESFVGQLLARDTIKENFARRYFVLNTEELATLYHPPTPLVMTGQLVDQVGSKKMGPTAGLPIFESDDTSSQFE